MDYGSGVECGLGGKDAYYVRVESQSESGAESKSPTASTPMTNNNDRESLARPSGVESINAASAWVAPAAGAAMAGPARERPVIEWPTEPSCREIWAPKCSLLGTSYQMLDLEKSICERDAGTFGQPCPLCCKISDEEVNNAVNGLCNVGSRENSGVFEDDDTCCIKATKCFCLVICLPFALVYFSLKWVFVNLCPCLMMTDRDIYNNLHFYSALSLPVLRSAL
ncbi:hypothetical protein AAMO2058_000268500 [Amorphochlora amoebiformis]